MAAKNSTASPSGRPPLALALLFLSTTASWFLFEYAATLGFDGGVLYDRRIESVSDLGVDYKQIHPLKHYGVQSFRAKMQNFNFMLNGSLVAISQLGLLLSATKSKNTPAKTMNVVFALSYAAGMVLMARVHAGPREKHWGTIGWHWNGFALVAIAGNLTCVLAGLAQDRTALYRPGPFYRTLSVALGVIGLYSFVQFLSLGRWDVQTKVGLWQRGTIYPIQVWQALTGMALLAGWSGQQVDPSKIKSR